MKETTKLSIFTKIYKWAYAKCKQSYLHIHHNDMMCPNCKEWFSITNIKKQNEHTRVDLKTMEDCEKVVCGQCNSTSFWVWGIIPGYLRVDEHGNIIE